MTKEGMGSFEDLRLLFEPRSLALVGATNNLGKWGCIVLGNIIKGGYRGEIYPVHPTERTVLGLRAYRRIADIGRPVELAVIVTPAHTVPGILKECIKANVRMAIVITSGFSETGTEGTKLEREVVALARQGSMRIVGPNSMGIYSAPATLLALMAPIEVRPGEVALISQSGNLGVQILGWGSKLGIGFHAFVSTGNEGDLSCEEYLRHFSRDTCTRVILLYIEGIDRGEPFFETLRKTTTRKPVVILKGGRTPTGSQAARSHTGALAGDRVIIVSALKQAGAVMVNETEELLDLAVALLRVPFPRGNKVAVITRGGGWGVLAADMCEESGLYLPPLTETTRGKLDRILPPYWSHGNPVDMAATLNPEAYIDCLSLLARDPSFDGIIALGAGTGPMQRILHDPAWLSLLRQPEEETLRIAEGIEHMQKRIFSQIGELMEETGKPILPVSIEFEEYGIKLFDGRPIPIFTTPERAVRTMAYLVQASRSLRLSSKSQTAKGV